MSVQAVNAFETQDKRLFTNEQDALCHELHMDIHALFEKHYRGYRDISIDTIIKLRKELVEILTSEYSVALYKFENGKK